jgi:hypothetical protein
MLMDLVWALVGAVVLAVIGAIFRKPRNAVAGWLRSRVRAVQGRLYLDHRIQTDCAISRISAELAYNRRRHDGNGDDEFQQDWYDWFMGTDLAADASGFYTRLNDRVRERLERNRHGQSV